MKHITLLQAVIKLAIEFMKTSIKNDHPSTLVGDHQEEKVKLEDGQQADVLEGGRNGGRRQQEDDVQQVTLNSDNKREDGGEEGLTEAAVLGKCRAKLVPTAVLSYEGAKVEQALEFSLFINKLISLIFFSISNFV